MNIYEVLRSPRITEKNTMLAAQSKYTFNVAREATKLEIKAAVEKMFNVQVVAVNTISNHGEIKRAGRTRQHRTAGERARQMRVWQERRELVRGGVASAFAGHAEGAVDLVGGVGRRRDVAGAVQVVALQVGGLVVLHVGGLHEPGLGREEEGAVDARGLELLHRHRVLRTKQPSRQNTDCTNPARLRHGWRPSVGIDPPFG